MVGGLIRDVLISSETLQDGPLDIDLAIEGSPAPYVEALAASSRARPAVHDRFGTASAALSDGTRVDLAGTRSERYSSPGALPDVRPASIEADLSRRDFTINAMALPLSGEGDGGLLDPFGGVNDLERGLIRTLHRDSFRDDPTRLIRAARYAARIGGTMALGTAEDARRHRGHLSALTAGRFGDAWRLLLLEQHAGEALILARRLKIPRSREARWKLPAAASGACQSPEHFWAAMGLLQADPLFPEWLPQTVGLRRSERSALEAGASMRALKRRIGNSRRPSHVADLLSGVDDPAIEAAAHLWNSASGRIASDYLRRRREVKSPLSAERLIELGVAPGPALGKWIREIEGLVWDGLLDPDDASSVARLEQRIRLSR